MALHGSFLVVTLSSLVLAQPAGRFSPPGTIWMENGSFFTRSTRAADGRKLADEIVKETHSLA